ncbi:hypothetical protein J4731_13740 [Providencia rettgeri]|nr:hypothetical protein [Providencia rettgeri]
MTDEYGNTELEISSLVEGSINIIATLNGDSRTIQVNFLRDGSTINIQPSIGTLFKSTVNEKNSPRTPLSLLKGAISKYGITLLTIK